MFSQDKPASVMSERKKYNRRIAELELALESVRDGPHDPDCGFCLGRIEIASKALKKPEDFL